MTRITNFGKKRSYLDAGLDSDGKSVSEPTGPHQVEMDPQIDSITRTGEIEQPLKKKRKRTKMSKRDGNPGKDVGVGGKDGLGNEDGGKGAAFAAGDAEGGEPDCTNHASTKKKKLEKDRRQKAGTFAHSESFRVLFSVCDSGCIRAASEQTDKRKASHYNMFCLSCKGTCRKGLSRN